MTYSPSEVAIPYFLPDCPEVRGELAEQYQAVSRMDQGIGLVLDELKKSGRYDDTLIVFISDNGIPFPGAKTTLYDAGVHLPMIVKVTDGSQSGLGERRDGELHGHRTDGPRVGTGAAAGLPVSREVFPGHFESGATGGVGSGLPLSHIPRNHNVLSDEGNQDKAVQVFE